ncbi:MAG: hypothetical protein JNN15_01230 [Blastocatellia bacterium]|nr:hypothetical protein [Blastocatellia bacterium]
MSVDESSQPLATASTENKILLGEAVPAKKMLAACILGYCIPGVGHLLLGKYFRGSLFLLLIFAMFFLGLAMKGQIYYPSREDLFSIFPSFANVGVGLAYFVCLLRGIGVGSFQAAAATFEYGNTFLWTAGLLNYLVVLDAYDIAIGRKR